MSSNIFAWPDEPAPAASKASSADIFAWPDEKKEQTPASPVTMNQKRGGSTVTEIPKAKGSDVALGVPGEAERKMGEGRSTGEILKDAAVAPAYAAATVAPMMTGGLSLPLQMGVSGASAAAESKLTGGSNSGAAWNGAIGAAVPYGFSKVPAIKSAIGRLIPGEEVYPGAHLPEAPPPEVLQARGLATGGQAPPEPQAAALGRLPAVSAPPEPPPVYPGAKFPAPAPPEYVQAQGLRTGGAAPPPEPAAALRSLPLPKKLPPGYQAINPEMPWGGGFEAPPADLPAAAEPKVVGHMADQLETKGIQEQIREAAEREDRERLSQAASDRIKASTPGKTKAELTGTKKAPSNPLAGKRMDFSDTPAPQPALVKKLPPGYRPISPQPDEDLEPLLKKSLELAKKKKT